MDTLSKIQILERSLSDLGYQDPLAISKILAKEIESESELIEILERLKCREPWQYIAGEVEFHSIKLSINSSVLIPRIESEMLVDITEKRIVEELDSGLECIYIDIGTGSGAIPISLLNSLKKIITKDQLKRLSLIGSDISQEALDVASLNISRNGFKEEISLHRADLFDDGMRDLIQNLSNGRKKSLIISANLPYISEEEYELLDPSVKNWEPRKALVGGINGDELILKLIDEISSKKIENISKVIIILELDPREIYSVSEFAQQKGITSKPQKDIFERERFLILESLSY